ncbi:MAG TPA: chemotaxis protein CheA [Dissulfurispiraceae bacterium]|nr:chemotaxis protein CheA [Dissulfurispiraceae bacterium]
MTTPGINTSIFLEEAAELLNELEQALMELEGNPGDTDLVGRIFRAMHTIKGSGAMFGFDKVAEFTHEIETAFDLVRNGKVSVSKELIDITLAARDQIRLMLDENGSEQSDGDNGRREVLSSLRTLMNSVPASKGADAPPVQANSEEKRVVPELHEEESFRIRFRPPHDIFMRGIDPLSLIREVTALGTSTVVARTERIGWLDEMDPEHCHLSWDIILTTQKGINAVKDIFIFIEEDSALSIETIDPPSEDGGFRKLGEILIERGDLSNEQLQEILQSNKKIGEKLVDSGLVSGDSVASALAEQEHIRSLQEKKSAKESAATIRVASEKLDLLVNLIGELVTVQAHLSQTVSERHDPALVCIAEEVERLTAELRDNTMNIRMMPIGTTFSKFKRLVRDLSAELGKEIDLLTEGAETELDKTVIEKLGDPLVHIIRNSIDHGIERPDARTASGKNRRGCITLSAGHAGAHVVIRIADDGAGLNKKAIRAKGSERGLIASDAELSDEEIYALILQPGFSTAKTLTNISGRGVGMDVVKQAVDALRGTINIASRAGTGTVMTLTLPLTLAIIDGLLVSIAGDYFIFPLSAVEECVELTDDDRAESHGRHLVNIRGSLTPYIDLREQFGVCEERPPIQQVVVSRIERMRMGFVVDSVIGQHQTVIKSLGAIHKNIMGLSGATILGDGTVALILDLQRIIEAEEASESAMIEHRGVGMALC